MISLEFGLGLACGLAIAGVLYLALWWWARPTPAVALPRDSRVEPPFGESRGRGNGLPSTPTSTVPVESPLPTAPPSPPPGPATPTITAPEPPPAEVAGPTEASSAPPRRPASKEAVRLSQRVILHVYSMGNLPPGAVAPPGRCQAGIGEALGITQGGLAAVLRRLEAAGILTAERGHVQGRDRRLKIYRLSSRGLEVARELRGRAARPPATKRVV